MLQTLEEDIQRWVLHAAVALVTDLLWIPSIRGESDSCFGSELSCVAISSRGFGILKIAS